MGTLLYASELLAQSEIDKWWLTNITITTKEFKEHLRKIHADYEWTQLWVSGFLMNQQLSFDDTGIYRIYHNPHLVHTTSTNLVKTTSTNDGGKLIVSITKLKSFEEVFNDAITTLQYASESITKNSIKSKLKEFGWIYKLDYSFEEFADVFENSDLDWTGQYNSENHKIYTTVQVGQHYSQSKGVVVDIKTMHPNHIYNTIKKKYNSLDLEDCFDSKTEIYQLLKAYFTYDIRQKASKLLE